MFAAISISQLVLDGYVSPHPVTAREQICHRYDCDLTLSGRECEGIKLIRDVVESLDNDLHFAKSLLICAPHTHWGYKTIVESFNVDDAVFLQGPTTADELRPISFVLTKEGPAPFEWMDKTVEVRYVELAEAYAFIGRLNAALMTHIGVHFPIPLGISIDHRFKQSIFEERLFGYVEGYHLEHQGRAVVRPILESLVQPENLYPDQVQVTWSCFPNSYYPHLELLQSEREALLNLEAVLRSMSPCEALEFMSGLQSRLEEQVGEVRTPGF